MKHSWYRFFSLSSATVLMFLLTSLCSVTYATVFEISDVILDPNIRSNRQWLITYLDIKPPCLVDEVDLPQLRSKLLTTEVISDAELTIEHPTPETAVLRIKLVEKWTTIPVLRGTYGGGTPFTVVGVYDTHSFGRLLTLGAEAQRYGNAPWGSVIWARAPRYRQGYHELGLELWRQFRIRSIYNNEDKEIGAIRSDLSMARILFMAPILKSLTAFKLGLDVRYRREAPNQFNASKKFPQTKAPDDIKLTPVSTQQTSPMLRFVYDDMSVDNLHNQGLRTIAFAGPLFEGEYIRSRAEFEAFYFYLLQEWDLNLGLHLLAGQTTSASLDSQYFLGGFESVRGLPDGALYGNRAAYGNFELRYLFMKQTYAWLQAVVFSDIGGAGQNWKIAGNGLRQSVGMGIRLAVPQVYRMMFRLDYAWGLDGSGSSGVALGMNQFFQPFKPL